LPATRVATGAVRSYRTFSPLPQLPEAVFFLCHYPSDCSARALPGALPSGVRTFLRPPPFRLRRDKPEGPLTVYPGTKAGDRLADCDAIDYRRAGRIP